MRTYTALLAAIFTLACGHTSAAESDDKERHALAARYAESINLKAGVEEHLTLMLGLSWSSVDANTPEFRQGDGPAVVEAVAKEINHEYTQKILTKMIDELADLYSVEELTALLTFSESAEGRSVLKKSKARSEREGNALQISFDYVGDIQREACKRLKCKTK
ncbi:hypothetical protein PQU92_00470 [Asticcacaulis sp. BYS171W]|uniref:DUF2059 domain-containing protein n=1 Tax=Asticcacaulis aquaticus TaxID=2984212 RepID=A0ABT5HNU4_9CAUL|nr:hypothetical protein [Asticcacaulis aquaticus]MDC7681737.1 hypothetical protein [Asticcacaulis aquaticus]